MIDTAKVTDRRKLKFAGIDDCMKEVDRIEAADHAGKLRCIGNWTAGEVLTHVASWIDYAYDGFPLKRPPFFIRWILRLLKKIYLRDGLPSGIRIPGAAAGTFGMEDVETSERASRLRRALKRLASNEPTKFDSPGFGPMPPEERIQFNLRHAELHLGFLVP